MVSTRKSLVAAGVGSLIGVGAVSAYVGLPELLREVVVSELEQRTGLPASVGSISVSPGGLTISALSVGDAERGAGARLDRVEIEAWPSSLAFEGISACRRVAVEGGHVRIPLGGRSGESGAPGAVQGSNPTARLPEVDLTAVSIELGDSTNGHESLRAVVAGSIRGDQAEVEITDLEARDGAHRVRVGRLRAAASLGARTLEVVEAEDVEVELDAERDPQTAFARARASLGLPAPSEPETVTAGADAPAVEVPPVPRLFGPSFRAEARNFRFRSNRGVSSRSWRTARPRWCAGRPTGRPPVASLRPAAAESNGTSRRKDSLS